jgi:hypothetical protein
MNKMKNQYYQYTMIGSALVHYEIEKCPIKGLDKTTSDQNSQGKYYDIPN